MIAVTAQTRIWMPQEPADFRVILVDDELAVIISVEAGENFPEESQYILDIFARLSQRCYRLPTGHDSEPAAKPSGLKRPLVDEIKRCWLNRWVDNSKTQFGPRIGGRVCAQHVGASDSIIARSRGPLDRSIVEQCVEESNFASQEFFVL